MEYVNIVKTLSLHLRHSHRWSEFMRNRVHLQQTNMTKWNLYKLYFTHHASNRTICIESINIVYCAINDMRFLTHAIHIPHLSRALPPPPPYFIHPSLSSLRFLRSFLLCRLRISTDIWYALISCSIFMDFVVSACVTFIIQFGSCFDA